jgi:hypothetical protein
MAWSPPAHNAGIVWVSAPGDYATFNSNHTPDGTMRGLLEALIALSASPNGFTASQVAARVCALTKQSPSLYGPRHAAYDLKKLRGKHIIRRIGHTRRYEPLLTGLRAMTALLVLRDKAIKPLLAAAQPLRPTRGAHNPKPIDLHYDAIQAAMRGLFHELGIAA